MVSGVLLAVWCAATWWLSDQSDPESSVGWFWELPDWAAHAVEYAVGGFLARATLEGVRRPSPALIAVVFCVLWGVVDEWHQSWIPGRDSSLLDVVADGVGGALGTLAWPLVSSLWRPRQE